MGQSPFLNPERADADGLVGVGGELSPELLVHAYRHGIFPYYDETTPILWWSPDPRAIFQLERFHVSRSLARTVRSGKFAASFNQDFAGVIASCSDRQEGTWITPEMSEAYIELHRLGFAHSVEIWHEGRLAGGVYGVAVGGLFAGESMFHRVTDASKVALVFLVERLLQRGFTLFDIQFVTDHTASLGATTIRRREYLARLRRVVDALVRFA